jgi:hypothetical protein
VLHSHGSG